MAVHFAGAGVAVDPATGAPQCDRCTHFHMPEDKCKLCGHVGRHIIFPGPADPSPPPPTFHTKAFDTRQEPLIDSYGNWRLGVLMRTRVMVEEMRMITGVRQVAASTRRTEVTDYDEYDDGRSRHILGLLGDAPVAFARWRIIAEADVDGGAGDGAIAVIDRLLVMRDYRQRKYGMAVLVACLTDILRSMIEMSPPASRISMFIPVQDAFAPAAHTALGCGLEATGAPRMVDPTGAAAPEFLGETGVQEFSMASEALAAAYAAALSGGAAGVDDSSSAAAMGGGGGGMA